MNIFLEYQGKIFKFLKDLEKKKIIKIPPKLNNISVELPPKNQNAEISCNAAMILSKFNQSNPMNMGEILRKYLLLNFKEFKKIEVTSPGFLNIYFKETFLKKQLTQILLLDKKFGFNKTKKKNITLNLFQQTQLDLYTSDIVEELY